MSKKPALITFTGVDDSTLVDDIINLHIHCASRFQTVEFGVLLSPSRQGIDPRYPSMKFIESLSNAASYYGIRLSAHYCGGYARSINLDGRAAPTVVNLDHFSRAQINHTAPNLEEIAKFGEYHNVVPIAQTRTYVFPRAPDGVGLLYDRSGGKGVAQSQWPPHPDDNALYGYAGGIGPDNVIDTLLAINADAPFWIDMESGVRTNEKFDIKKCVDICDKVFFSANLG